MAGAGRFRLAAFVFSCALAAAGWLAFANPLVSATSGRDPYEVPVVEDVNPAPDVVETTITAEEKPVDLGNGVTADAMTFNGEIPGPTFELNVGDTVIVHFHNHMQHATGIHWHGIELANAVDGTPFTQGMVPPGGTFLYKFTVTRPGIFWYHPHHHSSTNQVFRGMYGMIYVRDPNEALLQRYGVLPPEADTKKLVLSDTTVCGPVGTNPGLGNGEPHAYDDNADETPGVTQPWAGSTVANSLPAQPEPSPKNLCEGPNVVAGGVENPYPINEDGDPRPAYEAGEIPNIQTKLHAGRTNEGTIVLTNGMNVGARAGGPKDEGYVPGALAPEAKTLAVRPGQGLRLQILNAAVTRFMRLQLTDEEGNLIPLYRVGGEGGLLNSAILEGGTEEAWETGFTKGEIMLVPAQRADVVAAIPSTPTTGTLTLWTEDYERSGGGDMDLPTVPVMHLKLTGPPQEPPYTIEPGTELRAATGDPVSFLGAPTGQLLDPTTFADPKNGMGNENIALTVNGNTSFGINDIYGTHEYQGSYMDAVHLGSSRYAAPGELLELSVEDQTGQHHTFHLHGFSFQPIKLDGDPLGPGGSDYTWPYPEFVDNVHVPPHHRLYFRVRLDPRPLADGITPGGALGRWLFHCHIFFHHGDGMVSELVVTNPEGDERPDVNVDEGELKADPGRTATMTGTYQDPDGDPVTLSTSLGQVADHGDGTFTWTEPNAAPTNQVVYVTATDSHGLKDQIPFFLQVGPAGPAVVPPEPAAISQAPALALKHLRVTPKAFAVAPGHRATRRHRGAAASKRHRGAARRGAKIRFNLSDPARVRFTVHRLRPRKPALTAPLFSTRIRRAGSVAIPFSGRLKRHRALPPGRYMLTAEARDPRGLHSRPVATSFRIVR